MKLIAILVLVGALEFCCASRILFVVPVPSKSHYILAERLLDELAGRGHEVTVISPYKKLKPVQNIKEIILPDFKDEFFAQAIGRNGTEGKFQMRNLNPIMFLFTGGLGRIIVDKTMAHKDVQALLRSGIKFDLVVGECFLIDALLAGFAHRYNAPAIAISTSMPFGQVNEMIGNPAPSSYIPEVMLGLTEKMTFMQRVQNFLLSTAMQMTGNLLYLPQQDKLMREYFGQDLPPIKEIFLNTSLVLVNHHFSLAYPRPLVPNMIEIGGFHVRKPKPLPKDLQKFMDEAKDGVIYFSMGSNLQSSEFPKEKFDGILRAFSKLKQRILWKFETERSDLPQNVKISKWMPQSDILTHPNVRLFITHGGLLSLTESVFRGVPVIGVPIFGDQPTNVKQIVALNAGLKLEYDDLAEETLLNAIREILENPKYTENAKYRSRLLQDLPMPAIDKAIFWIEYVIRHKGAPHLRSGAQDLTWYQLYLLDVLLFLAGVSCASLFLFYKSFAWIRRSLSGKKKKETTAKKLN